MAKNMIKNYNEMKRRKGKEAAINRKRESANVVLTQEEAGYFLNAKILSSM